MLKQVHDCSGNIVSFISNTHDVATANQSKLSNPAKSTRLQMELVITVDVGNVLVKATYNLEGDGPLVLSKYEYIPLLPLLQLQCIIPILLLFAHKLSGGNQRLHQQLYDYICLTLCTTSTCLLLVEVLLECIQSSLFFFYPARVFEIKPPVLIVNISKSYSFHSVNSG